ncbi:MAG: type II toxin-antitoxin system VapC family toxin [Candidatus Xenobia bacterium]
MAVYYLDTSALTKLFVAERGSNWLIDQTDRDSARLMVCTIARAEFHSAVSRRRREGHFSPEDAEALLRDFDHELRNRYTQQPVTSIVIDYACALVQKHPLRAYDAIQLAACLTLHPQIPEIQFLCADDALVDVARVVGLMAENPNDHP